MAQPKGCKLDRFHPRYTPYGPRPPKGAAPPPQNAQAPHLILGRQKMRKRRRERRREKEREGEGNGGKEREEKERGRRKTNEGRWRKGRRGEI